MKDPVKDAMMDIITGLVEAFYGQTPELPKTSVQFKMRMNYAVDFLKESGVELPKYEARRAQFQADKEFDQQYLGEFPVDHDYEIMVAAWMAYHEAADKVDGNAPMGHPQTAELNRLAISAGRLAMQQVYRDHSLSMPTLIGTTPAAEELRKKWQTAKMDALRRLGK